MTGGGGVLGWGALAAVVVLVLSDADDAVTYTTV